MFFMHRHSVVTLCAALIVVLGSVDRVFAQQTRAETYTDAQEKKAEAAVGPLDNKGERIARLIETLGVPPIGWFPFVGNIYPGSWLAVGPGYRRPFDNGTVVIAKGAWSVTNFKTADVMVSSPHFAADRVHIVANAGWLDAPKLNFFGVGNSTDRDDRTRYGLRPYGGNASVQFRPVKFLDIAGGWGIERYEAQPKEGSFLSKQDFTLGTTTVSALLDWRPSPGWSNTGGAVRFTWKGRRSLDDAQDISYNEYEGEATELIPILRGNWVIALHGVATTTDTEEGSIPFFLLPNVGGPTSRGYSNFRFRDRNRLGTSVELRWSAAQVMDLALFVDAARVAATRRDLDFDNFHTSVGVGARFHTTGMTVFRAEIARGREGLRFTVGGGPVF